MFQFFSGDTYQKFLICRVYQAMFNVPKSPPTKFAVLRDNVFWKKEWLRALSLRRMSDVVPGFFYVVKRTWEVSKTQFQRFRTLQFPVPWTQKLQNGHRREWHTEFACLSGWAVGNLDLAQVSPPVPITQCRSLRPLRIQHHRRFQRKLAWRIHWGQKLWCLHSEYSQQIRSPKTPAQIEIEASHLKSGMDLGSIAGSSFNISKFIDWTLLFNYEPWSSG